MVRQLPPIWAQPGKNGLPAPLVCSRLQSFRPGVSCQNPLPTGLSGVFPGFLGKITASGFSHHKPAFPDYYADLFLHRTPFSNNTPIGTEGGGMGRTGRRAVETTESPVNRAIHRKGRNRVSRNRKGNRSHGGPVLPLLRPKSEFEELPSKPYAATVSAICERILENACGT